MLTGSVSEVLKNTAPQYFGFLRVSFKSNETSLYAASSSVKTIHIYIYIYIYIYISKITI